MTDSPIHVGVLASGRGSNLQALLQKQSEGYFRNARIVCVGSDISGAPALDIARSAGLEAREILPRTFSSKLEYENEVVRFLDSHGVQLVCLAGYMRIVGPTLLTRYANAMINIHPSLLPSFPGLHAQKQAVEHGVRISGCTVHFVDAGMDTGPIIAQRAVPVFPDDDEDALSARILEQEHELFAHGLRIITEQPWKIEGRRVIYDAMAQDV